MKADGMENVPSDSARQLRGRLLLGLAALVVLLVLMQGVALWPRLPERIPVHFGLTGEPDGWSGKGWFSVFGLLGLAAVLLITFGAASSRLLGARYYNFPGKERVLKLPREQQDYVLSPLREGMAWLGSSVAIAMALMARESWQVALGQRAGMPVWVFMVAFGVGVAAVIVGIVQANLRAGEAGTSDR
ncbi:MAG: DUF1648 domain-containing protein [Armatimonadota bacterium]